MEQLSESFISKYFYLYTEGARYNRGLGTYQGGCPICHEGKSWKRKHRCYYIPKENRICCHNCGFSSQPIFWIAQVTGKTAKEIYREFKEDSTDIKVMFGASKPEIQIQREIHLPEDSVNLFDEESLAWYRNNGRNNFEDAITFLKKRKLDVAVNRGNLYYSFSDRTHGGRIIIPFCDVYGKLQFFQSRAVNEEEIRYVSSGGFDKTIYGLERLDLSNEYVFIQEGPFNTFFLKNSVAIGGINPSKKDVFSAKQKEQMESLIGMKRVWILDNPYVDHTANEKIKLLEWMGESYFQWPRSPFMDKNKDLNDVCIATNITEVSEEFILKFTKLSKV